MQQNPDPTPPDPAAILDEELEGMFLDPEEELLAMETDALPPETVDTSDDTGKSPEPTPRATHAGLCAKRTAEGKPLDGTAQVGHLPEHMKYRAEHPLAHLHAKRLDTARDGLSSHFAINLSRSVTIEDLQNFRNMTAEAAIVIPQPPPTPVPPPKSIPPQLSTRPSGPGAIYLLIHSDGMRWKCVPHHAALVGTDRPDLQCAWLTAFSVDSLTGQTINTSNYHTGDAIFVTSLAPKPTATHTDLVTSFENVHESKKHKFWTVEQFALIQRSVTGSVLCSRIKAKGLTHGKALCVASGVNTLVVFRLHSLRQKKIPSAVGDKFMAHITDPLLQPNTQLASVVSREAKRELARLTAVHAMSLPILPEVVSVSPLHPRMQDDLRATAPIFDRYDPKEHDGFDFLATVAYHGFSAAIALSNKHRDIRLHTSRVDAVTLTGRKPVIEFELRPVNGATHAPLWERGTQLSVTFGRGDPIAMDVESLFQLPNRLLVTAKPSSSQPRVLQLVSQSTGVSLLVTHRVSENTQHFASFPSAQHLRDLAMEHPIRRLLVALFSSKDEISAPAISDRHVQSHILGVILSPPQSTYVNAVAASATPIVVANSPFGTGKTTTTAVAINTAATTHPGIHVATTVTNAAIVQTVRQFLKIQKDLRQPACRLVTEQNYETLDEELKTSLDFPALWPQVLRKHVFEEDVQRNNRDPTDVTASAIIHLARAGHLREHDLKTRRLQRLLRSQDSAPVKLQATFMMLLKPCVIFATAQTLVDALRSGMLAGHADRVSTIQVDESSQFPLFNLFRFATLCKTARYAFFGDAKQLAPYADVDLLPDLKQWAVGDLLRALANKCPHIDIKQVRRCPRQLTIILSELFYGGTLIPTPIHRFPTRDFARAAGLNHDFPVQVVTYRNDHTSATPSLFNIYEATITAQMVSRLRRAHPEVSVGILSYYKAHAGHLSRIPELRDVFIGTIDASQGQEFEVTFIQTSRSSSFHNSQSPQDEDGFIEDPRRLNVALSRAKGLCVVLLNPESARTSHIWNRLLDKIPQDAFCEASMVER